MSCRHAEDLTARWDYITHDGTSGTGWIACTACHALLERVTVAGGKFRGHGRFLAVLQEQIAENRTFSDLRELEVD